MRHELRLLAAALLVAAASTFAMAETFSALRGSTPLDQEGQPPVMTPEMNTSEREARNYPEQPPLIPHSTEGYEVSIRGNKCLSCHARKFTEQSQAPMISVTHYQDREGNTLGGVSPRRYSCLSCHVPQTGARPLVPNTFVDMDALVEREPRGR